MLNEYYVERNPTYFARVKGIFERIDEGVITAVTSPITLSECLVFPYRQSNTQLRSDFFDLIVQGNHTQFLAIDAQIGEQAVNTMRDYFISIFYSEEDEGYIADIPDLQYCSAFGETPEDALREVQIAKEAWLEAARASGKKVPVPQFRPVIYQLGSPLQTV